MVSDISIDKKPIIPEQHKEIHPEILKALFFQLPIENRLRLGSYIKILRLIFRFKQLPDNYIRDSRAPLPSNYKLLNELVRGMFPITNMANLKDLPEYRRTLQKYYICTRIPDSYFDYLLLNHYSPLRHRT